MTQAPGKPTLTQEELDRLEPAGRGSRLIASILDALFLAVLIVPVIWITGGFEAMASGEPESLKYSFGIGVYGYFVFLVMNGKLLLRNGQTIGKKLQRIRIVTLNDQTPDLFPELSKRYAIYFLIGYIPYIGTLLSFANLLLIFNKDEMCGHDIFASTRVVKF